MSGGDQKVLVASLWQRTSDKGNEYLSGFLGKARVIGFRGEPRPDGTPTWDLYLQPGKEQEERAGGRTEPRQASSSGAPRAGRVQRWTSKSPREAADAIQRPFFDDDISDIGGGR